MLGWLVGWRRGRFWLGEGPSSNGFDLTDGAGGIDDTHCLDYMCIDVQQM